MLEGEIHKCATGALVAAVPVGSGVPLQRTGGCDQVPLRLMTQVPLRLMTQVPLRLMTQVPLRLMTQVPLRLMKQVPLRLMTQVPLRLMTQVPLRLMTQVPLRLMTQGCNVTKHVVDVTVILNVTRCETGSTKPRAYRHLLTYCYLYLQREQWTRCSSDIF